MGSVCRRHGASSYSFMEFHGKGGPFLGYARLESRQGGFETLESRRFCGSASFNKLRQAHVKYIAGTRHEDALHMTHGTTNDFERIASIKHKAPCIVQTSKRMYSIARPPQKQYNTLYRPCNCETFTTQHKTTQALSPEWNL